jgi:hypothetical protein
MADQPKEDLDFKQLMTPVTSTDLGTSGCERLHTEVSRSTDLHQSLARAESFFSLMPTVTLGDDDAPDQEPNLLQCSPEVPSS